MAFAFVRDKFNGLYRKGNYFTRDIGSDYLKYSNRQQKIGKAPKLKNKFMLEFPIDNEKIINLVKFLFSTFH